MRWTPRLVNEFLPFYFGRQCHPSPFTERLTHHHRSSCFKLPFRRTISFRLETVATTRVADGNLQAYGHGEGSLITTRHVCRTSSQCRLIIRGRSSCGRRCLCCGISKVESTNIYIVPLWLRPPAPQRQWNKRSLISFTEEDDHGLLSVPTALVSQQILKLSAPGYTDGHCHPTHPPKDPLLFSARTNKSSNFSPTQRPARRLSTSSRAARSFPSTKRRKLRWRYAMGAIAHCSLGKATLALGGPPSACWQRAVQGSIVVCGRGSNPIADGSAGDLGLGARLTSSLTW